MKRLLVALTLLSSLSGFAQTAPKAAGTQPSKTPAPASSPSTASTPGTAPAAPTMAPNTLGAQSQPNAPMAPNTLGAQSQPNATATFRGDSEFRRGPRGTPVVLTREELEQHLARMEDLLGKALERSRRWEGRGLLNDAHDEVNALREIISNAPEMRGGYGGGYDRPPSRPPPPPPPAYRPVSDGRMGSILDAMSRESFGRDKLDVLQSASVGDAYFSVEQVHQVLEQFQFSKDRLAAVRVMWPRVLNKQDGYMLNSDFQFSNDKEELRRITSG